MCGGTTLSNRRHTLPLGLSPRVRGNHYLPSGAVHIVGSIPACAGEPRGAAGTSRCYQVYPRVCGGTSGTDATLGIPRGLSPRVRGNRSLQHRNGAGGGSIPACAGEPLWQAGAIPSPGVYPRVCGGTGLRVLRNHRERGLSPRVRGNPVRYASANTRRGSIPACAGEPTRSYRQSPPAGVYPRVCGGTSSG